MKPDDHNPEDLPKPEPSNAGPGGNPKPAVAQTHGEKPKPKTLQEEVRETVISGFDSHLRLHCLRSFGLLRLCQPALRGTLLIPARRNTAFPAPSPSKTPKII